MHVFLLFLLAVFAHWVASFGGLALLAFALYEMRVVLSTLLPRVSLRLADGPAKVTLRSFLFAPAAGTRAVASAPRADGRSRRGGRKLSGSSPRRHQK